ncbi:MarR family winged helix-turn-helix transcriptional regulator [Williamsia sp. SKLECPSW1]
MTADVSASTTMSAPCADDRLAAAWHDLTVRYHRVSCEIDRTLQAAHGLTGSEFEVIELLAAAEDHSLRMSELAGRVHLSQSALSRLVAGLEKDGLATRSMCAADRRSVFTALTDSGLARYAAAKPTHRAVLRATAVDDDGRSLCGTTDLA